MEKLLLHHVPGVHRVVILGHGVRKQSVDGSRQPIFFVHADHTAQIAEEFARKHTDPEGAQETLQDRHRIISVWRPLNGTVLSAPIAFASAASLNDGDIFPVETRYADRLD